MRKYLFLIAITSIFSISSIAQKSDTAILFHIIKIIKNGNLYGSWGYNEETYTKSNLYIVQPGLNNNYVFNGIQAHDHIGWDHLFSVQPTIPQYNMRLGYFFNKNQDFGFEINFDHTKYVVESGYNVRLNGKFHGRNADTIVPVNYNTLQYQLNNGANFVLFNLVKKFTFLNVFNKNIVICGLIKLGVGPVIPHVANVIFGDPNRLQFQFGGWDVGTEGTIRVIFFQHIYFEYCNKLDYARYSWLEIYDGRAHQSFGTYENIANIGYTIHLNHKKYPLSADKRK